MTASNDAITALKTQICREIDCVAADIARLPASQASEAIESIRRVSRDAGLFAVARLAHGLEAQLSRARNSGPIAAYLAAMREALWTDRQDDAVSEGHLAQIGLRYR